VNIAHLLARLLGPPAFSGLNFESIYKKGTKFYFLVQEAKLSDTPGNLDVNLTSHSSFVGRNPTLRYSRSVADYGKNVEGYHFKLCSIANLNGPVRDSKPLDMNMEIQGLPEEHNSTELYDYGQKYLRQPQIRNLMVKGSGSSASDVEGCGCNHILIVDDDAFNHKAMEYIFKASKFKLIAAFNGQDAIEKVDNKSPCGKYCKRFRMIFMDCNMPVMDGYEATKQLKLKMEIGSIPRIPIVACTAYVTNFDANKCLQSGMDDYLSKPVSKDRINETLSKWVT